MQLSGWQPNTTPRAAETVVQKGPFEQSSTDDGTVFLRDDAVSVTSGQAERLRLGRCGEQSAFFSRTGAEA